jgi:putative transcriptional regulator
MLMFTPSQIRDIRKKLGMSPTQFAAAVGVSENTVRRCEIGDRHPRYDALVRLNEFVGDNGSSKKKVAAS